MSNQYGKCHHTHYEGGPDCVHTAWQEGYLAAIDAAEAAVHEASFGHCECEWPIAAIRALRKEQS